MIAHPLRAHYLQHVAFEGMGSITDWLTEQGARIAGTRLYEPHILPEIEDFDLLVVMGGPMSVNDEARHAWLRTEKAFIRQAVRQGKPVLGICLGAQLMASSLGARVFPNPEKEIGWFPVMAEQNADPSLWCFPRKMTAFHWHGETFDLPDGAVRLASSQACQNQAFQIGRRAIGLQFHLETTPQSSHELIANCHAELVAARFVQSEDQLHNVPEEQYRVINACMGELLTYLVGS
jgi:GMP synthase-like glutamine amidotransferase